MSLLAVTLDDKYTVDSGRIFVTGIQALVRLPMLQRQRDLAAGHNTAGFISGYRGSPLGALDQQFWRAQKHLAEHHVKFTPGVNEDLAATSIWGTQQAELNGEGLYDGVFGMWYGKGPGVDRSGDAFRHGNMAGTSALGGVIACMGDDHTCESSTTSHQSEFAFVDAMMPVLNPAGVQDILDYGLVGWALSRYSGCWVGLKCVHDTVEATASIEIDDGRVNIILPRDFTMPAAGANIRWPDTPQEQERRLHEVKIEAVKAFVRANALDQTVMGDANGNTEARIGIVTTGKSYLDVRRALIELGINDNEAKRLGLRVFKVAMPWPLEPLGIRAFAQGLEKIIVVEEKRTLIEDQIKNLLYGTANAPIVIGKRDEQDRQLFQSAGRLEAIHIAQQIGKRILDLSRNESLEKKLSRLNQVLENEKTQVPAMIRTPYFCAGCPHNRSTVVPAGSKALAGIGCHYMAQWMHRDTDRYTQMGGEGSSWIGEAMFSKRKHIFQNIGDGTYFHSGLLAIRAAIASGVNITFKILYNDAVAMTGGQPMDGPLTVPRISRQVHAEGAMQVVVVTDQPDKYPGDTAWAPGVTIHHRDELMAVQKRLREVRGTTVLIYDQTCAAEKRRRRKRGLFPDPPKRLFINEAVCEGCGDCGEQSNCVAIVPVETELGRKRAVDQSTCNKDYSCVNGFCPSFVTVHGGELRKPEEKSRLSLAGMPALQEPAVPVIDGNYEIVLNGVGGTGVVTIGALLGMAAHISGKGISILDMLGLAQKGGAVTSHIIVAERQEDISATHVAAGGAKLVLACDLVVAAATTTLSKTRHGVTKAVVNTHEMMTGDFTQNSDVKFPGKKLLQSIAEAVGQSHGKDNLSSLNATRYAAALIGDSMGANLFMLGYAYQLGYIPLTAASIEKAIEINGVAVAMNKQAFIWGRHAVASRERMDIAFESAKIIGFPANGSNKLEDVIEYRRNFLVGYQNKRYANGYLTFVNKVQQIEQEKTPGQTSLTEAAAKNYFKLLSYKDEYEVARLYCDSAFKQSLEQQFQGSYKLELNLAPPLLAKRDPDTGRLKKKTYGPWMFKAFSVMAKLKFLRGTPLDVFGYSSERKIERSLGKDYEKTMFKLVEKLTVNNHPQAVAIANLPAKIRGFGHVKEQGIRAAKQIQIKLMIAFMADADKQKAA